MISKRTNSMLSAVLRKPFLAQLQGGNKVRPQILARQNQIRREA